MTNLDSILKSRDITLPTKVRLVKAMVFSVVMYGCESWTVQKAECQRIDAFKLWCWRRLFRVPCRRRNGREELPHVRGQGGRLRGDIQGAPKPEDWSGGLEELLHAPTPEARGGGREEQPTLEARGSNERSYLEQWLHQEGLEELSHTEGQKGWW